MKHILCFGDSNTYGLNPEWIKGNPGRHDENTRWPGKLQQLLGGEYKIIEEGLCGRTTVFEDPTSPTRKGIDYLPACIESHTPLDLIIIMLGTNDSKSIFNACPAEIASGAARLVAEARNPGHYMGGPAPKILIVSPVPVGEAALKLPDGITTVAMIEKTRKLAPALKKMADMYGCDFIDLAPITETAPFEGIHITAEGHAKIAEAMAEKVREILG